VPAPEDVRTTRKGKKMNLGIHKSYVLLPTGMYPKYPAVKIDTGHGMIDKEPPKTYFVGGVLVTIRP
jgi:hypothetical protein